MADERSYSNDDDTTPMFAPTVPEQRGIVGPEGRKPVGSGCNSEDLRGAPPEPKYPS